MSVKTWDKVVIDLAPEHTVLVTPLIVWGTEKKYSLWGEEEIADIVPHGVRVSPAVQPLVPDPYETEYIIVPAVLAAAAAVTACWHSAVVV